jgi:hypothetical protein
MATQIVILNKSYIKVDDDFHIGWEEKGNAMPALDDSIHAVVFNELQEIMKYKLKMLLQE